VCSVRNIVILSTDKFPRWIGGYLYESHDDLLAVVVHADLAGWEITALLNELLTPDVFDVPHELLTAV
jgi:hypothetical protein